MTLFKTSLFTTLSTIITVSCGFLIAKIFALFLGPTGFAMVGQFQNFMQLSQAFSGGMLGHGVIKYVAEYKNNEEKKRKIVSTAFVLVLGSSFFIGLMLFLFRHYFAGKIFHDTQFTLIITLFAFSFIFYVTNLFLLEVMNGENDTKRLTICKIISSIFSLVLSILLVKKYQLTGALLVLVGTPVAVFFITLFMMIKSNWFKITNFLSLPKTEWTVNLMRYALMTLTSALLIPAVQLFLRGRIIQTLSWQEAGYWDAITRISDAYLMIITSTLAIYYLPTLSQLVSRHEIKKEIVSGYKIIVPATILFAGVIFFLKKPLILLFFSHDFLPMISLFKYQLIGDVLKIGSWMLGYVMLAKAMVKSYIAMEILFSCCYILLSCIFLPLYGLIGITIAFALSYMIYWICLAILLRLSKNI